MVKFLALLRAPFVAWRFNRLLLPAWLGGTVAVVLGAVVLGAAAASGAGPRGGNEVPPLPVVPPEQASQFLGAQACKGCHAREYADYQSSMHAHTLQRVQGSKLLAPFHSTQKVVDPTRKAVYGVSVENRTPMIQVQLPGRAPMKLDARFAFGSGTQGYTYLFQSDTQRAFMQSRISYFTKKKKWDWTPGSEPPRPGTESPMGLVFTSPEALKCFICHSTMLVLKDRQIYPEQSIFNVGCERCHGPGAEHVRLARAGKRGAEIRGFQRAGARGIMTLCADCHRGPGAIPDARIPTSINTARFTGTALAASACYRKTPGGISCLSCHDAHHGPSHTPATYERACLGCHRGSSPKQKRCPVNPRSGCIGCHMPVKKVDNLSFHNHWIHAYR